VGVWALIFSLVKPRDLNENACLLVALHVSSQYVGYWDSIGRAWIMQTTRMTQTNRRARTSLEDGIKLAYQAYLSEIRQAAK
jgi:hypothetical protein